MKNYFDGIMGFMRICFMLLLFLTVPGISFAQSILWSQDFTSATSNYTNNGWTRNAGTNYNCGTAGDYCMYSASNSYLGTNSFHVGKGKGLSITFSLRRYNGSPTLSMFVRIGGYSTFNTSSNYYNSWMKLNGTFSYSSTCVTQTVTLSSEFCGGHDVSVLFLASGAGLSIDNISITDGGPTTSVPNISSSPLTYNFDGSSYWYGPVSFDNFSNSASGNIFSYRTRYGYNNSSGASASITSSGGNGGQVNVNSISGGYAYIDKTTSDVNNAPAPTGDPCFITREFNTSACSGTTATLRFAFKATYSGGYTTNEDYRMWCPTVYYRTTSDGTSTGYSWVQADVNYYFPNGKWWYAATSLPKAQNIQVAFATSTASSMYYFDDIKIVNKDCSICNQMGGNIFCVSNPEISSYLPNTPYTFTITETPYATKYKWIIRDLTTTDNPFYYGTVAGNAPAVVSGQGTQNVTINFGTSTSNSYRVICIPYDSDYGTDTSPSDACYSKISYYSTSITPQTGCTGVQISSQPSSAISVCAGTGTGNISVSVSGTAPYNYQWQIFNNTWENLSNGGIYGTSAVTNNTSSTSNTLTITNPDISMNGKQYRCFITNCEDGNNITSNVSTMTVTTAVSPTFTQLGPFEQNSTPPQLPLTSLNGINGTWNPSAINTSATGTTSYLFTPSVGQCAVTASMEITITPSSCSEVTIQTNPVSNVSVCSTGGSIQLSVIVNGSADFSYQWQILNGNWTNLVNGGIYSNTAVTTGSASSTNTLTISNPDISMNGKQYRCIISNCSGFYTATTTESTLYVTTPVTPEFEQIGPYQVGETPGNLPSTSLNGITGIWAPPVITTSNIGTTVYHFYPDPELCANETTISITVQPLSLPCSTPIYPLLLSQDADIDAQLQWVNVNEAESYDLYFGTVNPPPFYANVSSNSINILLDYQTTYYWKVIPKSSAYGSSSCDVWNFTTIDNPVLPTLKWTGSINTDWNNPQNWNNNIVPGVLDDIIIPSDYTHAPIINLQKSSPATCKDMSILPSATVTIATGKALSVKGNLINNGSLIIKSSPSGDGSLLIDGTLSGSGQYLVERYVSENIWHMISSPVENATATLFSGTWLREYYETTNAWSSYIVNPAYQLTKGKGFTVWTFDELKTIPFSGLLNHGIIDFPISYSSPFNPTMGWNLIGNPYPSAINWNAQGGWSKSSIANTIYLYNGIAGNYVTWNGIAGGAGSGKIAIGQAFFVQAYNVNSSLSINNNARLHDDIAFRNTTDEADDIIKVGVQGSTYFDETYLIYRTDASDDFDFNYDAVKMSGIPEAPQLYTKKQDYLLALNSVNTLDNIQGKIVYFTPGNETSYVIKLTHTMQDNFNPVLKDRLLNIIIPSGQEYQFTTSAGDESDRFEILEVNSTELPELLNQDISIWESGKYIHIRTSDIQTTPKTTIYNSLGALVLSSDNTDISVENLSKGVYIVSVLSNNELSMKKIIIF